MSDVPRAADAVLFDMDGVLVDSTAAHLEAWARFLDERGVATPEDGVASLFGRPGSEAVAALLGVPTGSAAQRAALEDLNRHADGLLAQHGPGGLLVPGAAQVIATLQEAGFRVAVGTSALRPAAQLGLGALWTAFETVVTAEDVTRGKPDPEVYLTAADRLGVPPAGCVVIEDAAVGVEAARRAGMGVIGITTTAAPERLRAAGAGDLVDDLEDVLRLLVHR